MRMTIATEGKVDEGNRVIQPGAIYIEDLDKSIPVMINNNPRPYGVANGFQRDVMTGEVSMEIRMHPSIAIDLDECEPSVHLQPVMTATSKNGTKVIINSGRLRAITLLPKVTVISNDEAGLP